MPRRHDRARERSVAPSAPARPLTTAPAWANAPGFTGRAVSGEAGKVYRCPGCQQDIRVRTPHLVVVHEGDVEGRRHWHTPCWRRELRRLGLGG